jgi:hypothetical protein
MSALKFETTLNAPLEQVYAYAKERSLKDGTGCEWDDANHRFVFPLTNAVFGKFEGAVDFVAQDSATKIVIIVDLEIHAPLIGPMITSSLLKLVTDNCDSMMVQLKEEFEAHLRTLPRPVSAFPDHAIDTLPRNATVMPGTNDLPRPRDIE